VPGCLHAADALLPSGWARDVLLAWDEGGTFTAVSPGVPAPPNVPRAAGPVIPGMPNLHSHAFQRVFAGLTEVRATARDDFWSWRDAMYRAANALTPDDLEAVATSAYAEMLEGGYTSVCEFHYLHNDRDGRPYADHALLSRAIVRAAEAAGIGLTLLPVLYQQGGFGGVAPTEGQRRFVRSTDSLLRLVETTQPLCAVRGGRVGLALHSLRAVTPEAMRDALTGLEALDVTAPRHIHVAEQRREVEECLAWSGERPVAWLLHHVDLDARWCLVHATHLDADEALRASQSGAVAGLCPTTEANLGDGVFDWPGWTSASGADVAAAGRWGIGSDSHVTLDAAEELRMLEYSQRLTLRRRNVAADSREPHVGTAMTLAAVDGGARASGRPIAGLAVGQRADFVTLDTAHPLLAGRTPAQALDAHLFAAGRSRTVAAVSVGGAPMVAAGRHGRGGADSEAFVRVRAKLLDEVAE
jgi:formimidoylglutamate deiminase